MIRIAHRINTMEGLKQIPSEFGVEIDVRFDNRSSGLYLNHEPGLGDDLEEYLKSFQHSFIIFNIKDAGIEQKCIELASKFEIPKENYFLLDVEFPYLYKASHEQGIKEIAVRYSEVEPIELAIAQKGFVDWVWIDTNTKLPLDSASVQKFQGFKTCLVSPEAWGRPQDIKNYRAEMKNLGFEPTAVMADLKYLDEWK